MKIIDLLNKIANGEETPKKIFCFNTKFYLKGNTYFGDTFTLMHYIQEEGLNEEVEILDDEDEGKSKVPIKLYGLEILDEDMSHEIAIAKQRDNNGRIRTKINEIIDYLEKQRKWE